jgi:hypothetical protein
MHVPIWLWLRIDINIQLYDKISVILSHFSHLFLKMRNASRPAVFYSYQFYNHNRILKTDSEALAQKRKSHDIRIPVEKSNGPGPFNTTLA